MRLALLHDCIVHVGGAERVLQTLHSMFPDAPIYTLVFDKSVARELLPGAEVRPSFVQKLPGAKRYFRGYAPLYPTAVEGFDLSDFDVVLSSSYSFVKGVIVPANTLHICYCYSPLRYLWSGYHFHRKAMFRGLWKRVLVDPFLTGLRLWDRMAADRVDQFVAISKGVAERIAKYYRRRSVVIYPPVPVRRIRFVGPSGSYYLLVSRLMRYKRVDLAIEALNRLGLPLKIVGTGPLLGELRRISKPNIEFMGGISEKELEECYSGCRGLVFPACEDFGIVMVEAQAYGKPVIAYDGGGASEIVADGRTGVLFKEQSQDAIIEALKRLERINLDPEEMRDNALRFDEANFRHAMKTLVERWFSEHHLLAQAETYAGELLNYGVSGIH
jgi:glycosyltransferase involved in cell wall biosynthesis